MEVDISFFTKFGGKKEGWKQEDARLLIALPQQLQPDELACKQEKLSSASCKWRSNISELTVFLNASVEYICLQQCWTPDVAQHHFRLILRKIWFEFHMNL